MVRDRPDYLSRGEPSRLFPVLSTTSKEGRTTSILLACLSRISELSQALLGSVGTKIGKRAVVDTYTEVVFGDRVDGSNDRPDGFIVVRFGNREWKALVETKVGNNLLSEEQIERYRVVAKDNSIDCVITISNQFATTPSSHPLESIRKSRSKIPVYHWSWMFVLTATDLLISGGTVDNNDHVVLLNELRRFLSHESAGVKGFDRMPPEWTALNKLVSAGGKIPAKSQEAMAVVDAWHQESKDLSLILSRQTETSVVEKLSRKHRNDPALRHRDEVSVLRETNCLELILEVPDAAAPINVVADLSRRTIDVGMAMRAPADRKSSKARVNWLLRQIKSDATDDLFVRLNWPGKSEATQFSYQQLSEDVSCVDNDKEHLQVASFHIFFARRIGARFTQQSNFISELETVVPEFYREVGQSLSAWVKPAPKIKDDRPPMMEVSAEEIAEQADENE